MRGEAGAPMHTTHIPHRVPLLTLVFSLLLSACAAQGLSPVAVDRLVQRTAQVIVTCPNGETSTGSGVFTSPDGELLTADHVVQVADQVDGCTITIAVTRDPRKAASPAYLAVLGTHDPVLDLAYLQVASDLAGSAPTGPFPYALLAEAPPDVGDAVHIVGFPRISEGLVAYDGGTIISEGACDSAETCWLLTDAFASWGSSGGPVFDDSERLVGIAVGSRTMHVRGVADRLTTARPLSALVSMVERKVTPLVPLSEVRQEKPPANSALDVWQVEIVGPLGANWRSEPSTAGGRRSIQAVWGTGIVLDVVPPGKWQGWWATANPRGVTGWVKESTPRLTLVRPFRTTVSPRLAVNSVAVVTCLTEAPCAPVRFSPGYAGVAGDRAIVGHLAGGDRVRVLDGPTWVEGRVWWQVKGMGNALTGWVAEVTDDGYRLLAPAGEGS